MLGFLFVLELTLCTVTRAEQECPGNGCSVKVNSLLQASHSGTKASKSTTRVETSPPYNWKGNGWCSTVPGMQNGRLKLAINFYQNRGGELRDDFGMDYCEEQCNDDPTCVGYVVDRNIPACSKMSSPWEFPSSGYTATSPEDIRGVDTSSANSCWLRELEKCSTTQDAICTDMAGYPCNRKWSDVCPGTHNPFGSQYDDATLDLVCGETCVPYTKSEYVSKGNGWCMKGNTRVSLAINFYQNLKGEIRDDFGMDFCEEECNEDPTCVGYMVDSNIPSCSKISPPWEFYTHGVTVTSPDEITGVDSSTANHCWLREMPQA